MKIIAISKTINTNTHVYEKIIKESIWVSKKKKNVVKEAPKEAPNRRNNKEMSKTYNFLFFTFLHFFSSLF